MVEPSGHGGGALDWQAGRPTILVQGLIDLILSSEGFKGVPAEDLEKALDLARLPHIGAGIVGSRALSAGEIADLRRISDRPLLILCGGGAKETTEVCATSGADDFLDLPFGPDELLSHVRFLVGDPEPGRNPGVARVGEFDVDMSSRTVTHRGSAVLVTDSEWRILEHLVSSPDGVALTEETLVKMWGPEYAGEAAFLKMWIGRLNRKLNTGGAEAPMIRPFHGVGYRLGHHAAPEIGKRLPAVVSRLYLCELFYEAHGNVHAGEIDPQLLLSGMLSLWTAHADAETLVPDMRISISRNRTKQPSKAHLSWGLGITALMYLVAIAGFGMVAG